MRKRHPVEGEYLPLMSPQEILRFITKPDHNTDLRIAAASELATHYDVPIVVPVSRSFEATAKNVEYLPDVEGKPLALVYPTTPEYSD